MALKASRFGRSVHGGRGATALPVIIMLLVAGLIALICVFCVRGCGKSQPPKYDRTKDETYRQDLKDVMESRKPLVKARSETVSGMEAVIAKARAALPAGATDDEVKAELEGHPEKYPEWKSLNEKIASDNKAIEDSLKDAQSRVRARLMKELGPNAMPKKPASARPAKKE